MLENIRQLARRNKYILIIIPVLFACKGEENRKNNSEADTFISTTSEGVWINTPLVKIPAGYYKPFYKEENLDSIKVDSFQMDVSAVTNLQYLEFVKVNPDWRRSKAKSNLADSGYLRHWKGDLDIGNPAIENSPVVNISWYAAREFAKWQGKRLPTIAEWEFAALSPIEKPTKLTEEQKRKLILDWYSSPTITNLPKSGSLNTNAYGVKDMHGVIWEWVNDFNSIVIPNDSRGGLDLQMFCGSGAFGSLDPTDYASFMRFALRSSLRGNYTLQNLGFRCVKDY